MTTIELQNKVIRLILDTNDNQLLNYLTDFLEKGNKGSYYELSEVERSVIQESILEYESGKTIEYDHVISKNERWLEE